ncbi:hypothetical protein KX729_06955 [Rhizobium sp. XQZ8]|uniref:hypothetical protein n=1 Tax=Rhizobium populisoli TaxID=2859785 RepID=UPI001CA4FD25|nr:hypothetical protein [Rhizobium populisoli]MBW6421177.1 hypothetical protein [Rhizobium populisoli]
MPMYYSHCGRETALKNIARLFWGLVALAAGFWLLLAMEMLRGLKTMPGAEWEREAEPEGRASHHPPLAVANDNPAGGR